VAIRRIRPRGTCGRGPRRIILNGTPSPEVIKDDGYPKRTYEAGKNHECTKTINSRSAVCKYYFLNVGILLHIHIIRNAVQIDKTAKKGWSSLRNQSATSMVTSVKFHFWTIFLPEKFLMPDKTNIVYCHTFFLFPASVKYCSDRKILLRLNCSRHRVYQLVSKRRALLPIGF